MGGDVIVESVEGRGTTFRIRLPATLPARASDAAPNEALQASSIDGDVILVIDDGASQRELTSRFLRRPHRRGWRQRH